MLSCTRHTSGSLEFKFPFSHYKNFEDFKQKFIDDLDSQSIYYGPFMNFEIIVDFQDIKDKYFHLIIYDTFNCSKLLLGNAYLDRRDKIRCPLNYNYNTSKFVYPVDVNERRYEDYLGVIFNSAYHLSKLDLSDDSDDAIYNLITPILPYIFPTYNLFISNKKWHKIYKALISMIRCLW